MDKMQKIPLNVGNPVEGNSFYGREKQLDYAWQYYILNGTSMLLSAPRRVGKSSFSKKMIKMAEEKGWKALYFDISDVKTESQFIKLFSGGVESSSWLKKVGDVILKIFDSVKSNKISIDSAVWRNSTCKEIQQSIENIDHTLIVIDELGVFLNSLLIQENGKKAVESFLISLRKLRQETGKKIHWIFCSSIGIENFASMHQLSKHLNDLKSVPLEAFYEYEAKDFISRLDVDEKIQFTEDDIQYILDKLVWHLPFFIQLLVEKINFLIVVEDYQLSNNTINEAYNRLLIENQKDFVPWNERLKEYHEFEDNSRKVLKLCAEVPTGRSREDLLANLTVRKSNVQKIETVLTQSLKMLKNDGYLIENNGKYTFRSPLLRDFWYCNFIK